MRFLTRYPGFLLLFFILADFCVSAQVPCPDCRQTLPIYKTSEASPELPYAPEVFSTPTIPISIADEPSESSDGLKIQTDGNTLLMAVEGPDSVAIPAQAWSNPKKLRKLLLAERTRSNLLALDNRFYRNQINQANSNKGLLVTGLIVGFLLSVAKGFF